MNLLFLLQLGVLALTVVLWWRVQQGLSGRASTPPPAEWERLRATVEQLTADLERRAVVAEQRVAAAEASLSALVKTVEGRTLDHPAEGAAPVHPLSEQMFLAPQHDPAAPWNAAFAHAEDLIAAGAVDAADIARQTGVSRGEAELLLSLRTRRV